MRFAFLVSIIGALLAGGCSHKPQVQVRVAIAPPPADPPPKPPDPPPVAMHGAEIDVPGEIEFDIDKASLKKDSDAESTLEAVRKILADTPSITKVRVEGHTDSDGSDRKNQPLSDSRAKAVVKWLVAKGIDEKRLMPVGCAARDPLAPNTSAENKAKNRRTEFDIEEVDGKKPDDYTAACAPNPKRKSE